MSSAAFLAVLVGLAFVATNFVCRSPSLKRRQPSYWIAVLGASGAVLVVVFAIYGRDLFSHRFWEQLRTDERLPAVVFLPLILGVCWVVAVIPALLVVQHYRRKVRKDNQAPP